MAARQGPVGGIDEVDAARSWPPGSAWRVLLAFGLLSRPWAAPLLAGAGVPTALLERPAITAAVHRDARRRWSEAWRDRTLDALPSGPVDRCVTAALADGAFRQVADVLGGRTAAELEQWVRRELLDDDRSAALQVWRTVLQHACSGGTTPVVLTMPPIALEPLLEQIVPLVSVGRDEQVHRRLAQLAPVAPGEGVWWSDLHPEAELLELVLRNGATCSALRRIASALSGGDRRAVVRWAAHQAEEREIPQRVVRTGVFAQLAGDAPARLEP